MFSTVATDLPLTKSMITSAQIIGGRSLGGAELFYARLVSALHRRGHPTLAVTVPDSLIATEIPPDVPRLQIAMRGVWDLWARWHIQKAMRQHHPDIVQTYMGRATRLTHLSARQRPIHIARLGGYYAIDGYQHAHAWIGNTRGICDYLIQGGLPSGRVFHISNFITPSAPRPPERLAQCRHALHLPDDALLVVAVGRLHPVKGIEDLLAAFAQLPACLAGRPVHLIIVGDGPLNQSLRHLAKQLGITARVCWTGWQRDPGDFQELADLIVCPSRHEPLGNVILEAWARRRPVLATRTLGPAEIARHEHDAWLTPVADPIALADAMQLLLSDAALRAELAANGYRTLLARHSEDAIVSAYLDLYTRLLAQ